MLNDLSWLASASAKTRCTVYVVTVSWLATLATVFEIPLETGSSFAVAMAPMAAILAVLARLARVASGSASELKIDKRDALLGNAK